jgi:hypothetical protein
MPTSRNVPTSPATLSVYHWNASHSRNSTSHWLLVQCSGQANPPAHVTPEQKGKPTHCKSPIPYKQPTTRNAFYNQDGWVSPPTIALHAYITLPLVLIPVLFLHNRALQFTCSVTITLFRPNHLATTLPDLIPSATLCTDLAQSLSWSSIAQSEQASP